MWLAGPERRVVPPTNNPTLAVALPGDPAIGSTPTGPQQEPLSPHQQDSWHSLCLTNCQDDSYPVTGTLTVPGTFGEVP